MKSLIKSFVYAFRGITYCVRHERNMRIHLCFTAYMFGFLTVHDFFEVSKNQFALLFAVCASVMALEAVNTAIEKAVDLETKEINPLAKISKDAAAGAVLIAAIGAVAVGIAILYQPEAFVRMFEYYKENIPVLIGFIVSFIVSIIFVFAGPDGIKNFFKNHVK
ncbi:MAG: diacylglycerol kinase family protein [Clostridia bacterium]|nr:diacylglycerol kinase family protein [Clostridia bacterium]